MTMRLTPERQLLAMVGIAVATGIAFGAADSLGAGLLAGALVLLFSGLLYLGRDRFDAINVMFGAGDERSRALYTKALAFSGNVLTYVIVGWFLVTLVQGEVDQTLGVLAAVGGVAFIVGAIIASHRS